MKFSSVFSAIFVFLHGILFYTIFFVKLCCCKFSCFLLIFCLDHFRLISPFLTFRVKFNPISKFSSKLKPRQPGGYRSAYYNKQEIAMINLFRFFDYFFFEGSVRHCSIQLKE